jgi:hypothetical protein
MIKKLDTTILRVSDVYKSKKWYEEKMELTPQYFDEGEKLVVFDAGQNSSLTVWQIKPGEHLTPSTSSSCYPIFSVDSAQDTRDQLLKKGVKASELIRGNGVIYFHIFDPDENLLEACQVHE